MHFTKMHGLGNDYVYVDGFSENIDNPAALAVKIADRHTGVGGDGLILILPPPPEVGNSGGKGLKASATMRMFNADGSEAEMCGNGIRCVCKLVHDHRLGPAPDVNPMRIMTGNGVLTLDYRLDAAGRVDAVTVDMGEPILDPADIPLDLSHLTPVDPGGATGETVSYSLEAAGLSLEVTCVSMGNPHAVLYVDDEPEGWHALGRTVEVHPAFPRRVNVHFVRVDAADTVTVWHWERGSGATLACGTGACAVAVAGVLTGRTGRRLTAHLPGGPLDLEWREADHHVTMTGPATEVFTGEWHD